MENASLVHELNGLRQRDERRNRFFDGLRTTGDAGSQRRTVDELHRKIRVAIDTADVVNLDDMWMLQLRDGLCFRLKPG
nr:hypothetical protein [Anatilimnocola aggregata]